MAVVASLHARRAGLHCVGGPASSWSMVLPGADGAQRNGPIDAASGRATGGEGFSIAFLPLQILIVLIVLHVRAGGRACTGPGNHRRVAIRFASCLPRSCTLISRGKILRTSQLGEAVWYSRRTFAMSAGCLCARNRANAHSTACIKTFGMAFAHAVRSLARHANFRPRRWRAMCLLPLRCAMLCLGCLALATAAAPISFKLSGTFESYQETPGTIKAHSGVVAPATIENGVLEAVSRRAWRAHMSCSPTCHAGIRSKMLADASGPGGLPQSAEPVAAVMLDAGRFVFA